MKEKYKPQKAVIYCRVSSTKQTTEGNGLRSQETRCRQFAEYKDYDVVSVFEDDASGGLVQRKGMMEMLSFLTRAKKQKYAVIIDDISRLARGLEAHMKLRRLISDAGGLLESPSIEFGDDPDSLLHENLMASVSQHQRQKNAEQTLNRMKARVHAGYNVSRAPYGYRYERKAGHGKVMVRNEPLASIVQEGLEGFASGRFQSQSEVKRFLESKPAFPCNKRGEVSVQQVKDILTRPIYAGYVHAPSWNIGLRKGIHEGLIDFATFEKIQDRLNSKVKLATRVDVAKDFPLRGFVLCNECDKPMTASWSKGRLQYFPYYRCNQKSCENWGKSINANKMHAEFEELLTRLEPSKPLIKLATVIFKDVWDIRIKTFEEDKAGLKHELDKLDKKITTLLDRIIDTDSETIIAAYEKRIKELEYQKLALTEKTQKKATPKADFWNTFKDAMDFLSNPQKLWASEQIEDKRAVLKLAFTNKLSYIRNQGFGTPEFSLPFMMLGGLNGNENGMVPPHRLELRTY